MIQSVFWGYYGIVGDFKTAALQRALPALVMAHKSLSDGLLAAPLKNLFASHCLHCTLREVLQGGA